MIPIQPNQQTYYFSINHVTKQLPNRRIYGVLINSENYYLSKSVGINNCIQLDSRPLMVHTLLDEIGGILTGFEVLYSKCPELELLNLQIVRTLAINRQLLLQAAV